MNDIQLNIVDTLTFYQKGKNTLLTEDEFSYELMTPVKTMWDYLNAPIKPKTTDGYDVVMASEMLGIWTPKKDFSLIEDKILLKRNCYF